MPGVPSELRGESRERRPPSESQQVQSRESAAERGVSPVIGVILMVAITVILAAVIATFVLSIGEQQEEPQLATFEVEQIKEGSGQPDELRITMTQGEPIDAENLYLSIEGDTQIQESNSASTPGPADRISWAEFSGDDTVRAGESISPVEPEDSVGDIDGKTVLIIWEGEDDTSIIDEWEGPTN